MTRENCRCDGLRCPAGAISLRNESNVALTIIDNCKGITLVEALVASVIGVVLAGIIVIIYLLFDVEVKENNAYLIMQQQYENLSEQIAFNARRAMVIVEAGEAYYDTNGIADETVTAVRFYGQEGVALGGVGIFADTVKELDASNAWVPFTTGNGTVCVKAGSNFVVTGSRDGIMLNLTLKLQDRDTTWYLDPRKDKFLCRN